MCTAKANQTMSNLHLPSPRHEGWYRSSAVLKFLKFCRNVLARNPSHQCLVSEKTALIQATISHQNYVLLLFKFFFILV